MRRVGVAGVIRSAIPLGAIFIGYRRDDTAIAAAALFARLRQTFPRRRVFMDLGISPGEDFRVATALRRPMRVIPVLVDGATMPPETSSTPSSASTGRSSTCCRAASAKGLACSTQSTRGRTAVA